MSYQTITNAVQYGNYLFNSYPAFFHALLPIGTIFTAILGMRNSNHLKKQANLQREIEGNRYKIDLFEKRFNVYEKYKPSVLTKDIIPSINSDRDKNQLISDLKFAKEEASKCILVFNKKQNNRIMSLTTKIDCLNSDLKLLDDLKNRLGKIKLEKIDTDYDLESSIKNVDMLNSLLKNGEGSSKLNEYKDKKVLRLSNKIKGYELEIKKITSDIDMIKKNFKERYINMCDAFTDANTYMEESLSIPELAFEADKPGLVKRIILKLYEKIIFISLKNIHN
ncbi:hypothetical protein [Gluconobacter sp. OJB]|uniref:hypothetical protein n=1 Tax=Gluconobacter sp. OJB TaxID=3145196 RepID=UPI0031F9C271